MALVVAAKLMYDMLTMSMPYAIVTILSSSGQSVEPTISDSRRRGSCNRQHQRSVCLSVRHTRHERVAASVPSACPFVRALKGNRLELSTPNTDVGGDTVHGRPWASTDPQVKRSRLGSLIRWRVRTTLPA